MMSSDEQVIFATRKWLESLVVAHNFCPFAKREFERGSIAFHVSQSTELESSLADLLSICYSLDDDDAVETALLIFPISYTSFDEYLELLYAAEEMTVTADYEGVYQVASFHPHYCFDGESQNDPANFTNRSPYPILHLLREASVEKAIASHPDPDAIPENNIRRARQLGSDLLSKELAACLEK